MIRDARELAPEETLSADLCIVGAGAAGIALALELIDQPASICLLESGGFEYDQATQALYEGAVVGQQLRIDEGGRLRYFGGSTNHWSGWSRPFEDYDFAPRSWLRNSGWPFERSLLLPYYRRAHAVLELGPMLYEGDNKAEYREGLGFDPAVLRTVIFRISPPTRFGTAYRDTLAKARNVTVLLNANALHLTGSENGREVVRCRAATLDGKAFSVHAKRYVLAAGGIENARLLLNSDREVTGGLGNAHDLVGRYFSDHPVIYKAGIALLSKPKRGTDAFKVYQAHDNAVRGLIAPAPPALERAGMPGSSFALDPIGAEALSPGVNSMRALVGDLSRGELSDGFLEHLGRVVGDLDDVAHAVYSKLRENWPNEVLFNVEWSWETTPDPESRITLDAERDALGQRRVRVDWRMEDWYPFLEESFRLLGQELGRLNLGRVQLRPRDEIGEAAEDSYHHMGTTRMHIDPRLGVVDADCRVHDMANLYIAGSSVFPTFSYVNPTLTIVALALRLADHLKQVKP